MDGTSPGADGPRRTEQQWQALERVDDFRELVSTRSRYLRVMNVSWIVMFVVFMLLVAFGQGFLTVSVAGPLTVGFVVVAIAHVLAFVLVAIYARSSNSTFAPMERRAIRSFEGRGDLPGGPPGGERRDDR